MPVTTVSIGVEETEHWTDSLSEKNFFVSLSKEPPPENVIPREETSFANSVGKLSMNLCISKAISEATLDNGK